jgi:hypothetical protein
MATVQQMNSTSQARQLQSNAQAKHMSPIPFT